MTEPTTTETAIATRAPNRYEGANALYLDTAMFEAAERASRMLAKSTMVPAAFQNKPENVMIAMDFAQRLDMNPFQVMQNMYVIKGTPSLSSQMLIALANTSKAFTGSIKYRETGKGDDLTVTAYAVDASDGEECSVTIRLGDLKKGGNLNSPLWKTIPAQQMRYRAAAYLVRAYCPEAAMGLYSKDEIQDTPEIVESLPAPQLVAPQSEPEVLDAIFSEEATEKAEEPAEKPKPKRTRGKAKPKAAPPVEAPPVETPPEPEVPDDDPADDDPDENADESWDDIFDE